MSKSKAALQRKLLLMHEKDKKKKWRDNNIVAHQGPNPLEHSANTT